MSEAIDTLPVLMTVAAAVKYSGLSRTCIYELLAAGRLKAKKNGRSTLVIAASLLDIVNNLKDF